MDVEKPHGMTSRQAVFDRKGQDVQRRIAEAPGSFKVDVSPYGHKPYASALIESMGPLTPESRILEVGCGLGEFYAYLVHEYGSTTVGIDISFDSAKAASQIAALNCLRQRFANTDATDLPFAARTFDVVVGVAVLHHLSKPDVLQAFQECHRVLGDEGRAIFVEPIEDSKAFDLLQSLFRTSMRPSRLAREAWREYRRTTSDRTMTSTELRQAAAVFRRVSLSWFGLFNRLSRLRWLCKDSREAERMLSRFDARLFRLFPLAKRFARVVLVEGVK
jgi:ubiquinone/menaquinone biosynthesis C-methylase UbiE